MKKWLVSGQILIIPEGEECCGLYAKMFDLSASESWTLKAWWYVATSRYSWVEMGRSYNGIRVGISEVVERIRFHLGDSEANDKINPFLACEDNNSNEKVNKVVFFGWKQFCNRRFGPGIQQKL